MSDLEMVIFIAVMTFATFLTRLSAFLLPGRIAHHPAVLNINKTLPAAILSLLVIYSVKDSIFQSTNFKLPELMSISIVVLVHLWRRNALVSIFSGTFIFMLFKQTKFFF